MTKTSPNLDALLDSFNARQIEEATEEIPEPGTEGNPWIGFDRIVRGQKTFYALSGRERRQLRRHNERANAAETARGQRAYNRQQRKIEFDKGTVKMQLGILRGDVPVSPAMMQNLTSHIERQQLLHEREQTAPERKAARALRRETRLVARQLHRYNTGRATHADLVALGAR